MPKDSKLIIEKAREQLTKFADLALQIEKTLGAIDYEEEKLKNLEEDGKGIKNIKERLKSFFSA